MSLQNMRSKRRSQQSDRSDKAYDASSFVTDIVSLMHLERTSSVDLNSYSDLEWNNASECDDKLNYALSRMLTERDESKILFLETLELAEMLKKENRVLKEKLGNDSILVAHLREQLMLTDGNNEILVEEVEDLKTEMDNMARGRVKLSESIVLANAKISKQEKLLKRLEDLANELEQERAYRKQIACRLWESETRLKEAEKLTNQLMEEHEELKAKFEKSSNSLSHEVIHTFREEKLVELSHEKVSQVSISSEVWSDVAYEKVSRNIHFPNSDDEDPLNFPPLSQLLYSNSDCESLSMESELSMPESDVHRYTVNANNDTMNEIDIKEVDIVDSLPQFCKEQRTLMARLKRLLHGERGSPNYKSRTLQADNQYRWSKYPALLRGWSTTISL